MTLTKREAATLRAALHCWQNELSYFTTEELQGLLPRPPGYRALDRRGGREAARPAAGRTRKRRTYCQQRQTVSRRCVMKAALYARVSTLDQEPENQLAELRRYAAARGWEISEYVDHGVSGSEDRRKALDALVRTAEQN